MLSTITITMYKQKNISVVVRKLSVCTRIPAMVGPTKLPKENADNQTPKNILKKITIFVTYKFKPRTPDLRPFKFLLALRRNVVSHCHGNINPLHFFITNDITALIFDWSATVRFIRQ